MDISQHPSLHKKKSLVDVKNRKTTELTIDEKERVNMVLLKFFELFSKKHQ
jgi:hypothetical protein